MPKIALAVVVVLALLGLALHPEVASAFGPERIASWLDGAGAAAPLALIAMMALAVVLSPIPSLPIDLAAGATFGPWLGTLYSVTGALIGAGAAFGIARALGADFVSRFAPGHIALCPECSDKLLGQVVFGARLVPAVSFDLVSYAAGLTQMSLGRFLLASGLGMLPATFFYNWLGERASLDPMLGILLGLGIAVLFLALPRWIQHKNPFGLAERFQHPAGEFADDAGTR